MLGVRHAVNTPDGRRVLLLINAAPMMNKGNVDGAILTMDDVTDSVLAEKTLRESLKTSADIVNEMPSGILIFRLSPPDDLVLTTANPTAHAIWATCSRWQKEKRWELSGKDHSSCLSRII